MKIDFPYPDAEPLEIPQDCQPQVFTLPDFKPQNTGAGAVRAALNNPIESRPLRDLAAGRKKVLIVADDLSRPTPIYEFISLVLDELAAAGVAGKQIEFLMALGSHRYMTEDEMAAKLGAGIVKKYKVHNHNWKDPTCLEYVGDTEQGAPVWINKLVTGSDLVIGLGSIMPIDICGFTGGGKILVPGVCGEITNSEMHWKRTLLPSHHILGKADNPVRASIDAMAKKAGLNFIVNVILDSNNKIVSAVAGDIIAAHRAGCETAMEVYAVNIPREFDIVIADSFPFDIEFWQANKALDTAGEVVKKGGVVILVAPCYEGFNRTHNEILEFGYLPTETVKKLVDSGRIKHKVVGVHMIQAGTVAVEKAKLILVSSGITKADAEKVGFLWAESAQKALEKALEIVPNNPDIAVLKNAARMLPIVKRSWHMELENKVAILTGAAGGIGQVTAELLAKEGATLALVDIDKQKLQKLRDNLKEHNAKVITFAIDVSDEKQVKDVVASTLKEFGKIDILVNEAAICRMIPILDIDVTEWDRILAVNLRSVFLFSREVFRHMKDRYYGKIISLASAAGKIGGLAAGAHYSASKAGVMCFTKSLALQAAPYKINVNCVCPGPTKTEMTDAWGDQTNRDFAAKIPFKEYAQPEDIAQAVLFLASDKAKYITGEILDVNGGLFMD